jgi:SNF2 family DNA or RNA helicase
MTAQVLYSAQDVTSRYYGSNYQRGKEYCNEGRVTKILFENNQLTAFVTGNSSKPYEVEINISQERDQKDFTGYCSCPVGYQCKHVVATLLEGIKIMEIIANDNTSVAVSEPKLDWNVASWLDSLEEKTEERTNTKRIIVYFLERLVEGFKVYPVSISFLKSGAFGASRKDCKLDNIDSDNRAKYIQDNDVTIARFLRAIASRSEVYNSNGFKILSGEEGILLLKMLIDTGRCYLPEETLWQNNLVMGESRKATIEWKTRPDGSQTLSARVDEMDSAIVLILNAIYYICPKTNILGVLETELPFKKVKAFLKAPAIKPEHAVFLRKELASTVPDILPAELPIRQLQVEPVACINLCATEIQPTKKGHWYRSPEGAAVSIASLSLSFRYDNKSVAYDARAKELRSFQDGEVQIIKRDAYKEGHMLKKLQELGFEMTLDKVREFYEIKKSSESRFTFGDAKRGFHKLKKPERQWERFMHEELPGLKEQGWQVTMTNDFPHNIIQVDDEWYAEVEEGNGVNWFGVELGVSVEGERLNLVPILLDLLKRDDDIFEIIKKLPKNKPLLVPLKDGRRIALPSERARILLTTLQHLFSFQNNIDENGRLRMQELDAALLAEMEAAGTALNMRWFGGERIRKLGKNLKNFKEISNVSLPKTFKGELRNYQQEGLNWLQFLKEYELGGILADEMGLGKTVQVLAHIAKERSVKKLEYPFLVIAPTSLMVNWRMEAEKFVPDLKVLTLHGANRKEYFDDINKYDLVLTTYPLLNRDKDILLANKYHTIILDEAQTIKNSKAKASQIVNQLKADHRLCMTGTPMENHLGELWSLFNFLLPGYLGDNKQFNNLFRTPIEKAGDTRRNEVLSKRIKPFILRRTKQAVVTELPKKTEMIRMVELEGKQRDLYETIRVSMDKKLRDTIAERGVARSHIMVLSALLKLRQVCCDPALIKSGIKVTQSAKREELMKMLREMVEDGRKILLFSQFTSMLALIEEELVKEKIDYVKLTGQTIDRETPVRDFQAGKIPIFLISLKAGGTGLNLTAADTVIHYDPWWNPAVEDQATDRAHRIGQDKPVFVYKLITSGTVEEKIIEMQAKKRKLMDGIFDPVAKASTKLTATDIQSLFEPLT